MDKKIANTYMGLNKSVLDRLNKNFFAEPIKDLNRIDELMSIFIQGEPDTIDLKLNSNEILNFKDQTNQTLIHAILRNESPNISEEKKLSIIRQLIDDKNVSMNTMTKYNQNPLHLACQKGYSLIISYLIDKGCDQTLIDNYGNTSIHYLTDKFVCECGDNDFYSQTNKSIKSSNDFDFKKINKILKNQSLINFFNLFSSDEKTGEIGKKIINALKTFIKNKVKSSLPLIYELIDEKVTKINEIFGDFNISNEIKLEKAKKIIYGINNDVFGIYNIDMEFTNINWDNFFSNQNLKIKNKKKEIQKSILEDIEKIQKIFELRIHDVLKEEIIDKIYSHLLKFMSGVFFLFYVFQQSKNNCIFSSNNIEGKIFDLMTSDHKPEKLIFDNDTKKLLIDGLLSKLFSGIKVFLNGIDNINNLDTINICDINFLTDNDTSEYKFYYNNNDYDEFIYLTEKNIDDKTYLLIPNEIKYNDKRTYINNFKNNIKDLNNFKILKKNIGFPRIYLLHNLLGSTTKRKNHSNPLPTIHLGPLGIFPDTKSKRAPTDQITGTLILSKFLFIHFSCFGVPIPTNNISGELKFISSNTLYASSSLKYP